MNDGSDATFPAVNGASNDDEDAMFRLRQVATDMIYRGIIVFRLNAMLFKVLLLFDNIHSGLQYASVQREKYLRFIKKIDKIQSFTTFHLFKAVTSE